MKGTTASLQAQAWAQARSTVAVVAQPGVPPLALPWLER